MDTVLKIKDLLAESISLRSDADKVRREMEGKAEMVLDFTGVVFASRSFLDELHAVLCAHPGASLRGLSGDVASTWAAVQATHREGRRLRVRDAEIFDCRDMRQLAELFRGF